MVRSLTWISKIDTNTKIKDRLSFKHAFLNIARSLNLQYSFDQSVIVWWTIWDFWIILLFDISKLHFISATRSQYKLGNNIGNFSIITVLFFCHGLFLNEIRTTFFFFKLFFAYRKVLPNKQKRLKHIDPNFCFEI